jgi:hypothetical protein
VLIDTAISGERNVIKKEAQNILKYEGPTTEVRNTRTMKTEVIPIIITTGATEAISRSLRKYLSNCAVSAVSLTRSTSTWISVKGIGALAIIAVLTWREKRNNKLKKRC